MLEEIDTSNRLAPGTYVPVECVYMNPASSYFPGDLSDDYRYTVTIEGFYTDGKYPYCNANVDAVDWGWKSMKDSAEDLKFFLNWMGGDYAGLSNMQMSISSDTHYQKLDAQTHLLLEDGKLYILHGGEARNNIEAVWAIYRLEAETITALKKGNDIVVPYTIEELTTLSGLSIVDLNPSTTAELVAIEQYGDTVLVLFRSDGELLLGCYEKTARSSYTRTHVLTQSELQPTDIDLVWFAYVEATGRELGVLICMNENVTAIRHLTSGSGLTVLEGSPALIKLEFAEPNWSNISADYEFLFVEIPTFPYPSGQNSYIADSVVVVYDGTQRPGYYCQSTGEIEMLMKILRDVPEESVQEGLVVKDYCVNVLLTCSDGGLGTNPEPLYIELRYAQDAVDLIVHDNTYWPSVEEGDLTYHIQDKVLNAYMDSLAGSSKISYKGIIVHHWSDVSEYSHDYASIRLCHLVGWEYEIVEYTDENTPFGIRCRPEWEDEGWVFVSFWPSGFAPDNEGLRTETYTSGQTVAYPADSGSDTDIPWVYYQFNNYAGDYVLLNEGADGWLMANEYITASVQVNQIAGGLLTRDEAIAKAAEILDDTTYTADSAEFDYHTGIWTVVIKQDGQNNPGTTVKLDASGSRIG